MLSVLLMLVLYLFKGVKGSSDLTLLDPGGDPFHIAIAVFFSRKRVFYYLTFIILGLNSFY